MVYKVHVEVGHVGSGKSMQLTRHVSARTATEAMKIAHRIPRVKNVVGVERVDSVKDALLGVLRDINIFWFEPRAATQIVMSLITFAVRLGGVQVADSCGECAELHAV
jgi:hypothetical protein